MYERLGNSDALIKFFQDNVFQYGLSPARVRRIQQHKVIDETKGVVIGDTPHKAWRTQLGICGHQAARFFLGDSSQGNTYEFFLNEVTGTSDRIRRIKSVKEIGLSIDDLDTAFQYSTVDGEFPFDSLYLPWGKFWSEFFQENEQNRTPEQYFMLAIALNTAGKAVADKAREILPRIHAHQLHGFWFTEVPVFRSKNQERLLSAAKEISQFFVTEPELVDHLIDFENIVKEGIHINELRKAVDAKLENFKEPLTALFLGKNIQEIFPFDLLKNNGIADEAIRLKAGELFSLILLKAYLYLHGDESVVSDTNGVEVQKSMRTTGRLDALRINYALRRTPEKEFLSLQRLMQQSYDLSKLTKNEYSDYQTIARLFRTGGISFDIFDWKFRLEEGFSSSPQLLKRDLWQQVHYCRMILHILSLFDPSIKKLDLEPYQDAITVHTLDVHAPVLRRVGRTQHGPKFEIVQPPYFRGHSVEEEDISRIPIRVHSHGLGELAKLFPEYEKMLGRLSYSW